MLDTADVTKPAANADVWERVITKLRMGTMPPVGRPRPDAATYHAVAGWLETEIDRAVAAAGSNPGRPSTVHRLNRAEYCNAIRDEALRLVAERGVDLNVVNADGNTALHAVAVRGYDSVVKYLVGKGARLDIKNKKGQTPLAAATTGTLAVSGPTSRFLPIPRGPKKSTIELLKSLGAPE